MAKLILMRHARSYTNAKKHKTANNDQNFLTVEGIQATIKAGQEFDSSITFDRVFSSTYPRTFLTATTFLSAMDHPPITVKQYDDIIERKYGFTEYMPTKVLEEMYSGEEIQGWDDHLDTVPGDPALGETQQQVYDRVINWWEIYLMPELKFGRNVLVVSHYYVMKAMLSHINCSNASHMPTIDVRNSEPVVFTFDGEKFHGQS